MNKKMISILFILIWLLTPLTLVAQSKKNTAKNDLLKYDFEELVIKVKIQEPEVLFITDKPTVVIEPFEKEMNFTGKITDPIITKNLF